VLESLEEDEVHHAVLRPGGTEGDEEGLRLLGGRDREGSVGGAFRVGR
jgi:hypothetical protein